jgi:hypothetical protein
LACSSYLFLPALTVFPARLFEENERLNITVRTWVFDLEYVLNRRGNPERSEGMI